MALKLAKDLRSASTTGFGITFSEGIEYDLDELLEQKKRDSSSSLVIEVLDIDDIAKKAINELLKDVSASISSTLENEKISSSIYSIISDIFEKYKCSKYNPPEAAIEEINFLVNQLLKSVYEQYNVDFSVKIAESGDIKITYNFINEKSLYSEFSKLYNKYADAYNSSASVSEGGLAIFNKDSKLRVNQSDYEKYLLDDCNVDTSSSKKPISLSPTKIKIFWEDGTEDTTTPSAIYTVYDEISKLQQDYDNLLDKFNELIKDKND